VATTMRLLAESSNPAWERISFPVGDSPIQIEP
jgi:hypothetical protein